MTNTKLLRERIEAKGLKMSYIAEVLFITPRALLMKIENESQFKPTEIKALSRILDIESAEERELYFFYDGGR